jgi:hypothetical protein
LLCPTQFSAHRQAAGRAGRSAWHARPGREYSILDIRSENYPLDPDNEREPNRLGDDGRLLAGITEINLKTGAPDHIGMVFKRPREISAG